MNPREISEKIIYDATTPQKKIELVLHFGTLAPSTHNSQPWRFLVKENSVEIYTDPKVQIIEADPKQRDLYISLGCAIENIVLGARYLGIFKNLTYRIGEKPNLIAELFFQENNAKDESLQKIIQTIPRRYNARGLFEKKEVPYELLERLRRITGNYGGGKLNIHVVSQKADIEKLANLTAEGLKTAYRSKSFRSEMASWMRNSLTRKKDGLPGYSLKMPFLISFVFPYLVRMFDIGKKLAFLNRISISSAPHICILSSDGETKEEWLETGRLGERLMLEAQSQGAQTSIFVASLEIGDIYKEVQKVLRTSRTLNFLFAIGYIKGSQRLTPRYNLEEKLQ